MADDASSVQEFDATAIVRHRTSGPATAEIERNGRKVEVRCPMRIERLSPAVGRPFACRVRQLGGKYEVVAFHAPAPPDVLENVPATVTPASDGKDRVQIAYGDFVLTAYLDAKAMYPAFIKRFAPGTGLTVCARAQKHYYVITSIVAPTAYAACDTSLDAGTRTVVAFVSKGWTPDAEGQFPLHFRELDDGQVFAQVFAEPKTLRAAGLRYLEPARDDTAPRAASLQKIAEWHALYQAGVRDEPPPVDRVEIEVEWLPHKNKWRLQRFLRPRATMLHNPGTLFDWVECTVTAIVHRPAKRPAADAAPGDDEAQRDFAEPDEAPPASLQVSASATAANKRELAEWEVDVAYDHPAAGKGTATGRMTPSMLDATQLRPDHRLIVTLKMYGSDMGIKAFHRRLPEAPESSPC